MEDVASTFGKGTSTVFQHKYALYLQARSWRKWHLLLARALAETPFFTNFHHKNQCIFVAGKVVEEVASAFGQGSSRDTSPPPQLPTFDFAPHMTPRYKVGDVEGENY